MSLTETKTTVLLIVALVATLTSHVFMTANFLDKEAEAAAKNAQLCEQADRIAELEGFLEDAHSLNHKLFRKVDDLRDGPTRTDRKAAYARLYK